MTPIAQKQLDESAQRYEILLSVICSRLRLRARARHPKATNLSLLYTGARFQLVGNMIVYTSEEAPQILMYHEPERSTDMNEEVCYYAQLRKHSGGRVSAGGGNKGFLPTAQAALHVLTSSIQIDISLPSQSFKIEGKKLIHLIQWRRRAHAVTAFMELIQ